MTFESLLYIILGSVLNMALGAFWYSKYAFGTRWCKYVSCDIEKMEKPQKLTLFFAFLNSCLIAYFIYFFQGLVGCTSLEDGVYFGFLIWLGFTVTTQISDLIWKGAPIGLFLIDTGYKLFSLIIVSMLLTYA
jgi:hypothetical protein